MSTHGGLVRRSSARWRRCTARRWRQLSRASRQPCRRQSPAPRLPSSRTRRSTTDGPPPLVAIQRHPGRSRCSRRRSRVRLFHVTPRVVQQTNHMMIVERVERQTSGSPDAHQTRGSKQPQLMRNGGFGERNEMGQVTHTPLAMSQRIEQSNPRGIAQQFEHVGNGLHRRRREQPPAQLIQRGSIALTGLGTSEIGFDNGDFFRDSRSHNQTIYEHMLICQRSRPRNPEPGTRNQEPGTGTRTKALKIPPFLDTNSLGKLRFAFARSDAFARGNGDPATRPTARICRPHHAGAARERAERVSPRERRGAMGPHMRAHRMSASTKPRARCERA